MKLLFTRDFAYWGKVVIFGAVLGIGLQFAHAWVAPTLAPPNGNIGLKKYVSDCNQFAVNGWESKDECLKDGRWHLVQSTSGGANADLIAAIGSGAEIRITYEVAGGGVGTATRQCANAFIYTPYAYCQGPMQYGGSVTDTIPSGTPDYYTFDSADPRPHATWGHMGLNVTRSDGRVKGTSIVPQMDGMQRAQTTLMENTGSVPSLKWYAKY